MSGRLLLFVVTEDWFFASHFLPMALTARDLGLEVAVVTRVREHRARIEATGARVIPLEADRSSLSPLAVATTVARLRRVMRRERPAIVHCISLRSIVTGGAAAALAGVDRRVFAVTGEGFIGASGQTTRRVLARYVRSLAGRRTVFLFENADDPLTFGLDVTDPGRVRLVGGAGVDPDAFPVAPLPAQPPLRVAMVSRLIWTKGVDIAVDAVQRARRAGAAVELSLYGAPDPANPKAIPVEQLEAWARLPGVAWHGRTNDPAGVWRAHHVCCVPSRGGEGLPRTMLEGAASGRAIVTTDVPGCRSFVRQGQEGCIVPPNDPAALAMVLADLAAAPETVAAMGAAARARVLAGYTEADVRRDVAQLYSDLLAR